MATHANTTCHNSSRGTAAHGVPRPGLQKLIRLYRQEQADLGRDEDANDAADALLSWSQPAGSRAAAIAALRLAIDDQRTWMESVVTVAMVKAALGYLERA